MYVYQYSQGDNLFTVGFFNHIGKWFPEMDCSTREEAADRVAWLNGSGNVSKITNPPDSVGFFKIIGIFNGPKTSEGYIPGRTYDLRVRKARSMTIQRFDGTGVVEYESLSAFLLHWDGISHA